MTSTPARGVDRVTGPIERTTLVSPALITLLVGGLALRLTIAYILLPGSGFASDLVSFQAWAMAMAEHGPGGFYENVSFADYPPGYLYVLWLVGAAAQALAPLGGGDAFAVAGALIKLPPMLADLAVGAVLYRLVAGWSGTRRIHGERLGLAAAALYVFNPVTWYDSAIWGQTDAVGALVILIGVVFLVRGNPEGASVTAVLAALVKPQFGVVLLPLVGAVLLRRHLVARGSGPVREPWLVPGRPGAWLQREQGPVRLLTSAAVSLGVVLVLIAPFGLDLPGLVRRMAQTAGGYPYLSVNAFNPWALFASEGHRPLAAAFGSWSLDTAPWLGPVPAVLIGAGLLAGAFLLGVARLLWRSDRWSIVVVAAFLSLAFFILPTRVHERYLFPVFALLPILAVAAPRFRWALAAISLGCLINLHGVLTVDRYGTDNVVGLPLGETARSTLGMLVSIALQTGGFVVLALALRRGAVRRPDPLTRALGPTIASAGAAGATPDPSAELPPPEPSWRSRWVLPAPLAAFGSVLALRPLRRDRSAELERESPGRFDRLDLLVLALVVVSALTLRGFRLEEPHDMHFDEVYHARTATEFLQHWRYGEPHGIYEYTHPHLAKYLMALGLIAFGNDRVTARSDLGVPVLDATIEERWSGGSSVRARYGDRLYVATGTDVRAYDLQTRSLVAALAVPAVGVAVDEDAHLLLMADPDGGIWTLPTTDLDEIRRGDGSGVAPASRLAVVSGPVTALDIAGGSLLVRVGSDRLVSVDPVTGETTGEAEVPGITAVVSAPSADALVVDPAEVDDPAAVADVLGGLLGQGADGLEDRIVGAAVPVVLEAYLDEDLTAAITAAIDDGSLPGVSIDAAPVAGVAASDGVRFLEVRTLQSLRELAIDGPLGGMALLEHVGDPTLYVANGEQLRLVPIRDDGPTLGSTVWMPAETRQVAVDRATRMVHVLGTTPDGSAATVYVVEPHANAVYADARLPFEPAAMLIDEQPERPAEDRQTLLAFAPEGSVASVDVGSHAFAWRLPGVIAGAIMAGALYVLARVLFARRSVGVLAAVLVLIEGMAFANARIAMNDTYVATLIVLALAAFAPLYLGRWRGLVAVGLGLPLVGLLLGLALASKWVGAYAIGLMLLLVLLRSALGRLLALLGMIALTGVLGYLGLRPAPDTPDPNLNVMFLVLMLVLTAALAAAMVLRPVRFTLDELRFVVVAPAALGAILVLAAVALGPPAPTGESPLAAGPLLSLGAALLLTAAAAYGATWLAARRGIGPLAPPRPRGSSEPVPSPAPTGWLRPGWAGGIPWLWALACLTAIPLAVYVASYLPWVALGNRLVDGWPAASGGQTLFELTRSMYEYHNDLRATHAASSPWWAWPLDLKPVWFYQESFANGTTGLIYDGGNVVLFWLAIPAVAFAALQAWRRRSLSLTLVVLAILALWLPWARIDRATFQYHVFTSLPFALIALAYLLAELWHGASARTFLLARAAGAVAILGPPLLWLSRAPLCSLAGTEQVHPNGIACGELVRSGDLTDTLLLSLAAIGAGFAVAAWLVARAAGRPGEPVLRSGAAGISLVTALIVVTAVIATAVVAVQLASSGEIVFTLEVRAMEIALLALAAMAVPAWLALRARDPRRWVVGALAAAAIFFVLWYPNLSALPLPSGIAQAYLVLLPTWNYDFQFAVNLDPAAEGPFLEAGTLLFVAAAAIAALLAMVLVRLLRSEPPSRADGPVAEPG